MDKTKLFQMRTDEGFLERLDEWRRHQPGIPSRAESVRRLVEEGTETAAWREFAKSVIQHYLFYPEESESYPEAINYDDGYPNPNIVVTIKLSWQQLLLKLGGDVRNNREDILGEMHSDQPFDDLEEALEFIKSRSEKAIRTP